MFFIINQVRQFNQITERDFEFEFAQPVISGKEMGTTNCQLLHDDSSFQYLGEEDHPTFGQIYKVKNPQKDDILGVKKIKFNNNAEMANFMQKVEQSQEYSQLLPLVRIVKVEQIKSESDNSKNLISSLTQCLAFHPHVLLYFCYHSAEDSVAEILGRKIEGLNEFLDKKVNQNIDLQLSSTIKMNEYQKIDVLPDRERKYINLFYREIQVLKVLDQLVTALYGLKHFSVEHGAISSENIFICPKNNKVVLVEKELFELSSNAELLLKNPLSRGQCFSHYIEPQSVGELQDGSNFRQVHSQRGDIFCLGLISAELCLLERLSEKIYSKSPKLGSTHIKVNKPELLKVLSQIRHRYSEGFFELLEGMLCLSPEKRLKYESIIQKLAALMYLNRAEINEVYIRQNNLSYNSRIGKNISKCSKNSSNGSQKAAEQSYISTKTLRQNSMTDRSEDEIQSMTLLRKLQKISNKVDRVLVNTELRLNSTPDKQLIKKDEELILSQLQKICSSGETNYQTNHHRPDGNSKESPPMIQSKMVSKPQSVYSFSNKNSRHAFLNQMTTQQKTAHRGKLTDESHKLTVFNVEENPKPNSKRTHDLQRSHDTIKNGQRKGSASLIKLQKQHQISRARAEEEMGPKQTTSTTQFNSVRKGKVTIKKVKDAVHQSISSDLNQRNSSNERSIKKKETQRITIAKDKARKRQIDFEKSFQHDEHTNS